MDAGKRPVLVYIHDCMLMLPRFTHRCSLVQIQAMQYIALKRMHTNKHEIIHACK